jgi:hypothetical protein
MLGVTFFGIFLTPVFYNVIQWISDRNMPADVALDSTLTNGSGHLQQNGHSSEHHD